VKWPADLEVYETKSKVVGSPGGVSAKIFEVLLIPRRGGKFTLPEQELAYFSPQDGAYKTKRATAVEIVAEGQGEAPRPGVGSAVVSSMPTGDAVVSASDGLLLPEQWTGRRRMSSTLASWIIQVLVGLSGLLLAGVGVQKLWRRRHLLDSLRAAVERKRRGPAASLWETLKREAGRANALSVKDLVAFYQSVAEGLYSELEARLSLPARAWSRAEIRRQIDEAAHDGKVMLDSTLWERINNVLEYSEALQFSGAIQEQSARSRMEPTLKEVERIITALQELQETKTENRE
jgi:hypothetical protein